jgi:hypothetical protein
MKHASTKEKNIIRSPAPSEGDQLNGNSRLKEYRKEKIMSIFSIALFLHIVGALGVSVALGLEWIGLSQIRRSTVPQQIRAILGLVESTTRFGFISMLTTFITGIYMVWTAVGWVPWILVVLGALILLIVLTRALTTPRMAAVARTLATEKESVSQTCRNLMDDSVLWVSLQTRVAVVLGIIFLKIVTPNLGGSLLTIVIALIIGIASAMPMSRRARAQEASTD